MTYIYYEYEYNIYPLPNLNASILNIEKCETTYFYIWFWKIMWICVICIGCFFNTCKLRSNSDKLSEIGSKEKCKKHLKHGK